jgi:hypothetical protein
MPPTIITPNAKSAMQALMKSCSRARLSGLTRVEKRSMARCSRWPAV